MAPSERAVVVGAGLAALRAAEARREAGFPGPLAIVGAEPYPPYDRPPLSEHVLTGAIIGATHAGKGMELRCGTGVEWLEDEGGRLVRAHLGDGIRIDADVAVIALGAVRNTGWLAGARLSADGGGVDCVADGHVLDADGRPDPRIAAADDVARCPHPLHAGRLLAGRPCGETYAALPNFWSMQGDQVVESAGLTEGADALAISQGDPASGRFVATYGRAGRCIAAVSVDSARWLPAHAELVAAGAPFPPRGVATDRPRRVEILEPGLA